MNRCFRIAVIIEDLRFPFDEGAKKTGLQLIKGFQKHRDVNICLITQFGNPSFHNVLRLPQNKFLLGYPFGKQLREQACDVLLYIPSSSGTVGALVRAASLKAQSRQVPTALLSLQYRNVPALARIFRALRSVDLVVTQSHESEQVFRSLGLKTLLLPGGVDSAQFRPVSKEEKQALRRRFGISVQERVILHVGHCNRNRNIAILSNLVKEGFRVVMIASTSTRLDHDLLAALRQAGVTVLTDYIENIQHVYQMSDCYVFPVVCATSAIDSPLSVLEAMACNLPVVTTRYGGLPQMFPAGMGLYYVETESQIPHMVKQAVEEQECRTQEKVSAYTWDNVTNTLLAALKETIRL